MLVETIVNGERRDLPEGATVADLIEELGLGQRRIAVELNKDIVPKAEYGERRLAEGDRVEIVHFVGGG